MQRTLNKILLTLAIGVFFLKFSIAQENSLLWEISKDHYHTSYLFGTMHMKNPRVFNFNDSVLICLEQSEAYAGEIIVGEEDYTKYASAIFEKDQSKQCRNVLTKEELNQVNQYLVKQSNKQILLAVPFMSPYMVALISIFNEEAAEGNDSILLNDKFLDLHLQSIADSLNHTLISLETFESQLAYIKNIEINDQKEYLLKLVNNQLSDSTDLELFLQLYEAEQLDSLYNIILNNPDNDPLITPSFIDDRNLIQMNSLINSMKKQSTFAAVGAAHLIGNNGLISLLREEGFMVRPIYKNK